MMVWNVSYLSGFDLKVPELNALLQAYSLLLRHGLQVALTLVQVLQQRLDTAARVILRVRHQLQYPQVIMVMFWLAVGLELPTYFTDINWNTHR